MSGGALYSSNLPLDATSRLWGEGRPQRSHVEVPMSSAEFAVTNMTRAWFSSTVKTKNACILRRGLDRQKPNRFLCWIRPTCSTTSSGRWRELRSGRACRSTILSTSSTSSAAPAPTTTSITIDPTSSPTVEGELSSGVFGGAWTPKVVCGYPFRFCRSVDGRGTARVRIVLLIQVGVDASPGGDVVGRQPTSTAGIGSRHCIRPNVSKTFDPRAIPLRDRLVCFGGQFHSCQLPLASPCPHSQPDMALSAQRLIIDGLGVNYRYVVCGWV